jgi:hypothetical protein
LGEAEFFGVNYQFISAKFWVCKTCHNKAREREREREREYSSSSREGKNLLGVRQMN